MGSLSTFSRRFQSDLQYRIGLVAYVPILCLGVLALGGLVFLPGSTGVRVYGIFALAGVAISAFVAHRTVKSVLDSLDAVAVSARQLVEAQESLLEGDREPIESWSELEESPDDELGVLAGAINAAHRNTLRIEGNQSDSIKKGISNIVVNLARRSQALLDRQVEYIDRLENTEEDPDRLEQMFKVDHLATRMRRNAESLLVLAEADPGRRRGGPVDVADVLRVAMGEIENYQHISLTSVEPGQVTAAAAVDLAHMTAELMENATQFSPPEAPVQVSGRLEDGQYVVSIVDRGMGMPAEQLAKANNTLVNPPELGLAMGRSLGFVVIGRLAKRVGADVELVENDDGGMTARIAVPTSVFTEVGDNSGVRRSVLTSETSAASEVQTPPTTQEPARERSPALSKLLGLDVSSMSGGNEAETATAEQPRETPVAPAAESGEDAWTPPPVTPDAPVALPPEVLAKLDEAPSDAPWSSPTVTPDPTAPPLGGRSSVEATAAAPPAAAEIEQEAWSPPAGPGPLATPADVPAADQSPADQVSADTTSEFGPSGSTEPASPAEGTAAEPTWLQPAVAAGLSALGAEQSVPEHPAPETVAGEAPNNLEDALPTGQAFESGMASLLENTPPQVADPPPPVGTSEGEDAAEPTSSGLTRRKRGQSKVPIGEGRPIAASSRNPEEIRSMLSRYRDGIKGNKSPVEPGEEG